MDQEDFNISEINPLDIGKSVYEVHKQFGAEAASVFVEKLAAKFAINVIKSDKDDGLPSEYIYNKIATYILFCSMLYNTKQEEGDGRQTDE